MMLCDHCFTLAGCSLLCYHVYVCCFFFSSRRRHTRLVSDWSSDMCSSDLVRDGGVQSIEPRAFDVLVYLIEQRHRTVTKGELLSNCWGDDPPGDGALARTIMKIRQATHDFDSEAPLIKTAHRVGYRFVGEVTLEA